MTTDMPDHFAELLPSPGSEIEAQIENGYARLCQQMFECGSFCKYALESYFLALPNSLERARDDELTKTIVTVAIARTAEHIRQAVSVLAIDYGVDLLNDRNALRDHERFKQVSDDLRARANDYGSYREVNEDSIGLTFALHLANMFGGDHGLFRGALNETEHTIERADHQTPKTVLAQAAAQKDFYASTLGQTMSTVRHSTQQQLRELHQDNVTVFLDAYDQQRRIARAGQSADWVLSNIDHELNLEMFPAGTELREAAGAIITESRPGDKPYISLERLAVLERVREHYGPENCQLVRGRRRGTAQKTGSGTLFGEEYIGLVIQHLNGMGETVEDLLAISPIALKHAGFLIRHDASEGIPWQDICRLPKQEAVDFFNARRLRFDRTNDARIDIYDAYYQKVLALFSCLQEQFGADHVLARGRDGSYRLAQRARRSN